MLLAAVTFMCAAQGAKAAREPAGRVGVAPLVAVPSQSTDGAAGQQIPPPNAVHAHPARRSEDDSRLYTTHCWAPGSAFTDPSCNCLGELAHPKLGSRRTIKIVVGGWYV